MRERERDGERGRGDIVKLNSMLEGKEYFFLVGSISKNGRVEMEVYGTQTSRIKLMAKGRGTINVHEKESPVFMIELVSHMAWR